MDTQRHWVEHGWSDGANSKSPSITSRATPETGGLRRPCLTSRIACCALLLLAVLAGCAVRAQYPDATGTHTVPPERSVRRLVSVWVEQLGQYVRQEGAGDPAALSQLRVLRSRQVLRPARIMFSALDVDAEEPGRDGWDVEGLLIGKQAGTHNSYVFLVGIVARDGYRPLEVQDIRLVALSAGPGQFSWAMSPRQPNALRNYSETFRSFAAVRFPSDTDEFVMKVENDRVRVQERRSWAEWSLPLGAERSFASDN